MLTACGPSSQKYVKSVHKRQTTRRQSGRRHLENARMKIKTRVARVIFPSSRGTIWLPPCSMQRDIFSNSEKKVSQLQMTDYGSVHRSSCCARKVREQARICEELGVLLKLHGIFSARVPIAQKESQVTVAKFQNNDMSFFSNSRGAPNSYTKPFFFFYNETEKCFHRVWRKTENNWLLKRNEREFWSCTYWSSLTVILSVPFSSSILFFYFFFRVTVPGIQNALIPLHV